jgi:hypothetical protein
MLDSLELWPRQKGIQPGLESVGIWPEGGRLVVEGRVDDGNGRNWGGDRIRLALAELVLIEDLCELVAANLVALLVKSGSKAGEGTVVEEGADSGSAVLGKLERLVGWLFCMI